VRRSLFLLVAFGLLAAAPAAAAGPVFSAAASWEGGPPTPGGHATVRVQIAVQRGWHVNSNAPLDPYLVPTRVGLELPDGWSADKPVYPPSRLAKFVFSEDKLAVFEGTFVVTVPVRLAPGAAGSASLRGTVEAQACNDQLCLAPAEVTFTVAPGGAVPPAAGAAPAAAGSGQPGAPARTDSTGIPAGFAGTGLLLQLAIVFLAGLALNLTPCVYPLIPITVGFFAAQHEQSRAHTWLLALVYVLGMSVTYSALGAAAALSGQLFGAALQSPWVVGLIVVVLLALASSMFGLWELRVPAWATRVSGGRSGLAGALVMGLVVGLVAAPCIGPFVLGLLTYVGQRQSVPLGLALFFTLSLGLGIPYLFLGVFTGTLERLPNSGAWMLGVRQLFGVLLVALAGYFSRPFLPVPWGDALFAGLLVVGGLYLLLVARPGHEQPWVDRLMRLASAGVLVAGVILLPARSTVPRDELTWQDYDDGAVARAMGSGQPVVLDFWATWCLPCKELDQKTFGAPEVAARLAAFARFKVDLTRNDPTTDALRKRYDVAGVPTVAFFSKGREVSEARLTGFERPQEFLQRLAKVTGSP
jgi:thiol:disulfide interchange protein DsbD